MSRCEITIIGDLIHIYDSGAVRVRVKENEIMIHTDNIASLTFPENSDRLPPDPTKGKYDTS